MQSVDLYPSSGATDDWAYGILGVPGYTIEVGPSYGTCGGFTPAYSCVDSTFWPGNKGALFYAAKAARAPYVAPLGPSVVSVTATPDHGPAGTAVTVTAVVDDGVYGTIGTARPAIHVVTAAEVTVDTPPWDGGAALPMSAQDGTFNTSRETATVTLPTAGLLPGRHLLFVRGRDASGSWGPTTSQWVTVDAPAGALFHTVAPCRAVDTRGAPGPLAGPALAGDGAERTFALAGACGVPAGAVAVAANVTATEATAAGDLRLFPPGGPAPLASVVNFAAGRTRANNAVLGLSAEGAVTVKADVPAGSVHLVIDLVGYFQ